MAPKKIEFAVNPDQLRMDVANLAGKLASAAKDAQERIEPAYNEARTRVVEDYIPRAQRAAEAAIVAAQTPIAPAPVKKKRRCLKCLGWIAAAGAAAGAAYVVWRRSQPVEDPWAEEYWADSEEAQADAAPSEEN